jgi:hypothetical protein
MEDFMPLWSSLEREQYTLQKLNSSGDENDVGSDGQRSSSPSSVWSMDSMDDEMYLEYLFSQGLADSLEKTISEIPTISNPPFLKQSTLKDLYFLIYFIYHLFCRLLDTSSSLRVKLIS